MKKLTGLLAFLPMLAACEGMTDASGVVLDQATRRPLAGVVAKSYVGRVDKRTYAREMTTDSTGRYAGSTNLVGCAGRCPDVVVSFSRGGYAAKIMKNPGDTVLLARD